jgi:hypothetical protein
MSTHAGCLFISEQRGLGSHQICMRLMATSQDFSEVIVNGGVIVYDKDAVVGQSNRLAGVRCRPGRRLDVGA